MVELDDNKVWIDGCFDFTHHGHAGAILQARQTIDLSQDVGKLYCGVHNDEDIAYNKGTKPVMNENERYAHTRSNRWCDYVIENAPYVTEAEWLDKYGCRYVVHGDDITLAADGSDCYQKMKDIDRFRVVKRTPSVSTTEIIHRMLSEKYKIETINFNDLPSIDEYNMYCKGYDGESIHCNIYENHFKNFIIKRSNVGDTGCSLKTILIEGDFDLFHIGHIEQLQRIKEDIFEEPIELVVSIKLADDNVNNIMTKKERILSVLACKYVDGIILNAQHDEISKDVYKKFQLDSDVLKNHNKNKFQYLNKQVIIDRILSRRNDYIARNKKKGMEIS
ncbi:hypothetical protein TPHA_0K01430 [Tetrapisispora phaffii CBS 4417]|uniref:ethanolamine-phosphate cytidylyltransferase n=1 Tax=Tetrapisispora phaffii (strain ATCC 24235 / CBS 4417 / NBRC 1672 / NRRL Y-8282 / UCD 70-5) TaxID=1071381 RepID=G8BZE8_TETPH|nr:hypothetical protein TPHA_0K01430 [Tetrapisispora phaffii CBS 4417]CCE65276.1 hypothetical protein TPHA_0K01430 [Tetrapisispora phaffii CBS 4417]